MSNKIKSACPVPAMLLPAVVAAVREAGAMLRAEFHRTGGPRGRGSHAEIDAEVEALLRDRLYALHPADWRGEELAPRRTGAADVWAVDPQDGTRAFLKGLRGAAVSVALLRQGQPVLGVVYAPTAPDDAGDLFAWAEGAIATRNGQRLPPLAPRRLGADTVLALNEEAGDFAATNHARFAPAGLRAIPSIAYRLALAAAGEVDAAISLTNGLDSYDIAGGHALLLGVGGVLADGAGRPVDHRRGRFAGCIGGVADVVAEVALRPFGRDIRQLRHPARPALRCADARRLDRAQGALLGLLAGDALGSQVEFQGAPAIRARFPDGLRQLLPGGTWNLLTGQPTDDGEMALCLARSIAGAGSYSPDAAGRAYQEWARSQPFDMGTTTRAGIAALSGRGRANAASQANGALMRAAPIGIAAHGNPRLAAQWARADAALTHPHTVCQAANAAFCAAIAVGIAGGSRIEMYAAAQDATLGPADPNEAEVLSTLVAARFGPVQDFQSQQGWVLIALHNAFHCLLAGLPLEAALSDTVMQGGDTDTNAAICGALIGAADGRSGLPPRWRSQILGCRAIAGAGGRHPRPPMLWADDAEDLAEALLVALQSA